jgi:hypothetical protein
MPTRRFERIALAQFLVRGCAMVFGACVLIEHAQAQPGYVPPSPPPPPPVFNPSSPNTVPQPSYTPVAPSTPGTTPSAPTTIPSTEVTSPANEGPAVTTAPSERRASVAKTRPAHHYRAARTPVIYRCGWYGCVRTEPWAFPCQYYSTYCYPYGYYYRRYSWDR